MINIGDTIDNRYRIIELIGSGGMADVFIANDLIANRFVAVKIMKEELLNDQANLISFKQEIQSTASLSHPNIVSIYNEGSFEGRPYLVSEYIKDQTLSDKLDLLTKFPLKEAIDVIIQVLNALEYTHSHKLIHRDIKPKNIFYFSNGIVKLGDYGIAINENAEFSSHILGSVHYLAPEVYKGYPYSVRSDIYAVGITLFELITGELPFMEDDINDVRKDHLYKEMPNASELVISLPKEIDYIIGKATAKNPANRYLTAEAFRKDL